jgi:hypothetical protein
MVMIRSRNFKDVVEKYTHSPATFATCRVLVVQIFLEIGSSGDCRNIHVPKHKTQVSNLWDAEGETNRGKHNMYEEQGQGRAGGEIILPAVGVWRPIRIHAITRIWIRICNEHRSTTQLENDPDGETPETHDTNTHQGTVLHGRVGSAGRKLTERVVEGVAIVRGWRSSTLPLLRPHNDANNGQHTNKNDDDDVQKHA